MSACKPYQRQIALLAANALDEHDRAALTEHLQHCQGCHAYSAQLRAIASLYSEDAERSVEAPASLQFGTVKCHVEPRLRWFKPAFGIAVVIVCATVLWRQSPAPTDSRTVMRSIPIAGVSASAPSIGNTRHLAERDLDELLKADVPRPSSATEVVLAVRTRQAEN